MQRIIRRLPGDLPFVSIRRSNSNVFERRLASINTGLKSKSGKYELSDKKVRMPMHKSKLKQEKLLSTEGSKLHAFIYRLKRVEAELDDCLAHSSHIKSVDSGLAKFYTCVVARRRAVETAMDAQEAR
jgi:hypothetical protein